MTWNWQQPDWPDFRWNGDALAALPVAGGATLEQGFGDIRGLGKGAQGGQGRERGRQGFPHALRCSRVTDGAHPTTGRAVA